MRFRAGHIIIALFLLAVSCTGPRKIPRDEMAMIFHDIFLQDQKIRVDPSLRRIADTSLVYEGIFNAYGYTTDDYLHTIRIYIENPDKMSKIFGKTADILSKELSDMKKLDAFAEWQKKFMGIYKQRIDTTKFPKVPPGAVDTMFFRLKDDQVKYFPPPDTLAFDMDTMVLKAPYDTLAFPLDSLSL